MIELTRRKKIIIASVVIGFITLNVIFSSYFRKREITRIVQDILVSWEKGDFSDPIVHWENKDAYPPIYDVVSYKIVGKSFGKKEGKPYAQFIAEIEFTSNNVFPSGKEWIFELMDTHHGWKIIDFHMSHE